MANVRKSKSLWMKVKKSFVPLMIEYAKNYTEIKALMNEGYLNEEQVSRLEYLKDWNSLKISDVVEDIQSALYQGSLDLDAFAIFLCENLESLEAKFGMEVPVAISTERLQDLVDKLRPGMKVIPEKEYSDVFE